MESTLRFIFRVYRYLISPLFGNVCRFYPSCSVYAEETLIRFGFFKGIRLSVLRLLKCHPWHEGGIDPIPKQCKKQMKNG